MTDPVKDGTEPNERRERSRGERYRTERDQVEEETESVL